MTLPYTFCVVDNCSGDGTPHWLLRQNYDVILLNRNRYPGFACNRGWEMAPADATLLQRADNDFVFLPGWCDEVMYKLEAEKIGQLGLRTPAEELHAKTNVGGNCIIRRHLFDEGLRYDERPWPQICKEVGAGYSEDSFLSPLVHHMGYRWTRVRNPCIASLATGDWKDSYYQESYAARGIVPNPADPTLP